MAKKKNNKTNTNNAPDPYSTYDARHSKAKVWAVRIIVALLCISVVVTLIPSVFF